MGQFISEQEFFKLRMRRIAIAAIFFGSVTMIIAALSRMETSSGPFVSDERQVIALRVFWLGAAVSIVVPVVASAAVNWKLLALDRYVETVMGDFCKPWRRKAGCVFLLLTSVVAASWMRSLRFHEEFWINGPYGQLMIAHDNGELFVTDVGHHRGARGWQSLARDPDSGSVNWSRLGSGIWFPHCAVVIPLVITATTLLLWPLKRNLSRLGDRTSSQTRVSSHRAVN